MATDGSTSFSVVEQTPSSAQDSTSLPRGSKILIIVTSSVAGALLCLFIVYVIHRMRKGDALVDVLKLHRRTHVPYMAPGYEYPIHFEQRYSVRSSRYPISFKSRSKNLPSLPGPATQSGVQMIDHKPPSMIMEPHMAYLKSSDKKFLNRSATKKSSVSNVPSISVRSIGDEPNSPLSSSHRQTRWSWTNSEAPSTPRLNMERKRTSSGSLAPNYKPVGSNDYHMDAIQEDSLPTPGIPRSKAQEVLETGGVGYLPPRVPSKSKPAAWKSVFRKDG